MFATVKTDDLRKLKQYPGLKENDVQISRINQKKIVYRTHIRQYSVMTYILLFFIFSLIGWMWEVGIHIVEDAAFVNRGTLSGPWLPIYGAGGTLGVMLLRKIENQVITFWCVVVICSVMEYFTSWYIEFSQGVQYWNYDGYFCNINGRICLEGALVFGFAGCAGIYILAPFWDDMLRYISTKIKVIVCIVLILLFFADCIYSSVNPNVGDGITDYISSSVSESLFCDKTSDGF